MKSHLKRNTR